ncbi:MAG TPA: valine--tRNA ligase [Clostridia bacterium]|nr:valine--tRNA ligase [Clostridia bacterium]
MKKHKMEKTYDPQEFEDRIYKMWMESGDFEAEVNPDKKPFTIVLPPPNITGSLHEGHALNHTMQDILIRYKRMKGFEALWLPGTDHASIATEVKILDKIRKEEGRGKEDLTREEFLDKAWLWKEKYGDTIVNQMKKLGNSCDWRRERFTMDEGCSRAVTEVFIRLYEEGLIYRGTRLINWCSDCGTSLSDVEVEHEEVEGAFYHINYPIEGSDKKLVIATTRPETILGDTAIAVHPEDSRYKELVGKYALLPLLGRRLPIIADEYVDRELGTGALKITPAHDPNDYEIGKRHKLASINIFTPGAKINEEGGDYVGLDRFAARKKIVEDLKDKGYLVEIKDHLHSVGHCYRCHQPIEPRESLQWFVQMDSMAKMALESVEKGEMEFVPERFVKTYQHWLENIKDWCISRQLWWGHRIPAYYCLDCGEMMVSRQEVTSCTKCAGTKIEQDEDVLDTWFSSALWPFSTLGWPDKTPEMEYFYPTDVLITGYDIIFFWVVRMMFSGLKHIGIAPFHHTLINGIVRDAQGRKISKSLDNGTDPIVIIDEYGADALRFMLISGTSVGSDTRFLIEKVEAARNFANKLWNASRFLLTDLEMKAYSIEEKQLDLSDKWILSRLSQTTQAVERSLERYELGQAADRVLDFVWSDYCDWFIELSKEALYSGDEQRKERKQAVLLFVLEDILKLLHPFMPFITEEIWQHLPQRTSHLICSAWPLAGKTYPEEENLMALLQEAISRIRNIRAEMDIPPSKKGRLFLQGPRAEEVLTYAGYFRAMASSDEISLAEEQVADASAILLDGLSLYLPLDELIDHEKELKRLEKEENKLDSEIKRSRGKLNNAGFVAKAPAELVKKEEEKLESFLRLQEELEEKIILAKEKIQ